VQRGPRAPNSRLGVSPARVVVVDDGVEARNVVALLLQHDGFDVVTAADGDAALATILSDGADAIVSDLQMPGLDGLTLCRVLRSWRASQAIPIVVFTGAPREDPRLAALRELSGVTVLHKPMGLREISPVLSSMLATTEVAAP
jgi:CheY-like chemotaxis protein